MDIISVITALQTLPVFLAFTPTLLFIATWDRVAPFSSVGSPSDRNTFQVILATDGFTSTVIFNYGDIQWGERAEIGFNAGDGVGFLRVPSSGSNATLDIETQSNVGVPGQFFYRVDGMFRMFITPRAFYYSMIVFSLSPDLQTSNATTTFSPPFGCFEGQVQGVNLNFSGYTDRGRFFTIVEGSFEICMNGSFDRVCDIGWDNVDAAVVCNNLGYFNYSEWTMSYIICWFN